MAATIEEFSLREMEGLIILISIYIAEFGNSSIWISTISAILKIRHPKQYDEFKSETLDPEDIFKINLLDSLKQNSKDMFNYDLFHAFAFTEIEYKQYAEFFGWDISEDNLTYESARTIFAHKEII